MKFLLFLFLMVLVCYQAVAADFMMVQGRVFLGGTSVNPQNFNSAIEADGLKKLDKVTNYGAEITFPTFRFLELGARYTRRQFTQEENPENPATDYAAKGTQNSYLLLARIPFVKSSMFRFDVFAGAGGSNTTIKIKTASYDGELSRSAGSNWYATPYIATGASLGLGFKHILLYFEGGYESNKVDKFKTSGTVNPAINNLDLSGSYFMVGLMFDGIKGYKQK